MTAPQRSLGRRILGYVLALLLLFVAALAVILFIEQVVAAVSGNPGPGYWPAAGWAAIFPVACGGVYAALRVYDARRQRRRGSK